MENLFLEDLFLEDLADQEMHPHSKQEDSQFFHRVYKLPQITLQFASNMLWIVRTDPSTISANNEIYKSDKNSLF